MAFKTDPETFESLHVRTRKAWRSWLQKNHDKKKNVWLILYQKASTTPCVNYEEAVEEALCFGWIDSVVKKRDPESRYQFFSQRKPKSNWSKSNRQRAEKLIATGLMTPSGLAMIDLAKQSGTWTALVEIENIVIPDDLKKLFERNQRAARNFENFSASAKKIILGWIASAKKPETRQKRIRETVSLASKNMKANHPKTDRRP